MFLRLTFLFIGVMTFNVVFAQGLEDSVSFKLFTIRANISENDKSNSLNLKSLDADSLMRKGGLTLSEMMSGIPGINMLSTGIGINKPVLRGLYGNRLLVLLNGLKFDNQQWQEEHGLGLSENGLSRVEIIKGPLGVLYGSEAIGGVVNLVDEEKARNGTEVFDFSTRFNSNTLGGNFSFGYKTARAKDNFRIRLAMDNHADYSDGHSNRVLNSRFQGYTLKTAYGFKRGRYQTEFNALNSFNRFGFIFNDIYTFVDADARWNRSLGINPNHMVFLNLVSMGHQIQYSKRTKLQVNAGVQSNRRMENEGGGAISLDMHLLTFQYLVKLEHRINKNNTLALTHLNLYESNRNYGARKIVPNAKMYETNVSGYWSSTPMKDLGFELGAGVGEKIINTSFTPTVNGQGKEIQPFHKKSEYANALAGLNLFDKRKFNLKLNLSTGVRIPNLAELSSDGLHEGVFTYEIGNPNLKNEQLSALNVLMKYKNSRINFEFSPFYNHFNNYVWLAPSNEQWNGFPVFRYQQQDAEQYGLEAEFQWMIHSSLQFVSGASGMKSKTADGAYTPYTPANRLKNTLNWDFTAKGKKYHTYVTFETVAAQKELAQFELGSGSYNLLSAGISGDFKLGQFPLTWTLGGNNLLNEVYFDNLSRLKYFNLLNPGRNVFLSLKYICTKI